MIFPDGGYRPHDPFIAPARPRAELWRTFAGTALVVAVYVALSFALAWYMRRHFGDLLAAVIFRGMLTGHTPGMLVFLLFTFLMASAGVLIATRALHGRRAGTLFGPGRRAVRDFLTVAGAVGLVSLLALPLHLGDGVAAGVPLSAFLIWLPAFLPALLIQTGTEELIFRGYLQQQLAARFAAPQVWILLPAALFAALHWQPQVYGANAVNICFWALLFGVCAADLTARTGSLGAAIGFHFANNAAAFLLVGVQGSMDGMALWTLPVDLTDVASVRPILLIDMALLVVSWLAARLALRV